VLDARDEALSRQLSRQLSLFSPIGAAKPSPDVNVVAERLPDGLYLGTSSWSFPGWEGIVYDRKVRQSVLARHGLAAYAEHPLFSTVCIDRTYYGPISKAEFADYADAVPENFRFVVKAHEMLTRIRMKDDPASLNPQFLDVDYAMEEVIGPCLEGLKQHAAVLLLQFPPQRVDSIDGFSEKLHHFVGKLPKDLLYAIELRNEELLSDSYIQAIKEVGACHCFNVHPTMPPIEEQARRVDPSSLPALIVRWMLARQRTYGDAKDAFYPFNALAEPDAGSRKAIATLCRSARRAFVIVNNKAEGSAPLSLIRLAEEF
jgi:uncharacterized protein YecE (DUF72 family)